MWLTQEFMEDQTKAKSFLQGLGPRKGADMDRRLVEHKQASLQSGGSKGCSPQVPVQPRPNGWHSPARTCTVRVGPSVEPEESAEIALSQSEQGCDVNAAQVVNGDSSTTQVLREMFLQEVAPARDDWLNWSIVGGLVWPVSVGLQ